MSQISTRPAKQHTVLKIFAVGLGIVAIILGIVFCQALSSSSSSDALSTHDERWPRGTRDEPAGPATTADGILPERASVFSDDLPGVTQLEPNLLAAIRAAASDAADDGIEFFVNSGWRSPKYQKQLLNEAVATYGSVEEAANWVATPETSPHVSGEAVDIGDFDATYWLSQYGATYGLCQIYSNESWHYELRDEAATEGCPLAYLDPTHDPRMQR
ncbi:M15 family metallopeptidase [Lysinibacter cavernae]|uniref:D-alanyl-D-alanine carboxypeptidase-like core domain-containing protein n=1 Tax=Lysinibacter cavernae TaxID=1640652 RepID=A0A7X5TSP2_9MICO|nr:M15 family metallopeptidase [Lysinibacter cavernae]NIH53260.1 hypothetical protein [Lysinibacter cavernae]